MLKLSALFVDMFDDVMPVESALNLIHELFNTTNFLALDVQIHGLGDNFQHCLGVHCDGDTAILEQLLPGVVPVL